MAQKLTDKQRLFVLEYIVDFNAAAAARRAGYAPKSARVTASRMLTKANIQAAIQRAVEDRAKRTEITGDRVVEEYGKVGFSNIRDFLSWTNRGVTWKDSEELDVDAAACVAEVSETFTEGGRTRRFKLHSKLTALDALARHTGVFGESGNGTTVNVNVNNRPPGVKKLSELSDEELAFYERMLAPNADVPNN